MNIVLILTEIGFVIAFGVLLDTFVVRSLLVPALIFDIGPRVWWPSTLGASVDQRVTGAKRRAAGAASGPDGDPAPAEQERRLDAHASAEPHV